MFQKIKNLRKISEKTDYSAYDTPVLPQDLERPVYGFYHIYCVHDWERIVREQIARIHRSGLYDLTDCIYVSAIAVDDADVAILKKLLPEKYNLLILSRNPGDYEMLILHYLWQKAQTEHFYAFYFHTKGVSADEQACDFHNRRHPGFPMDARNLKQNSERWRQLMEYFVFDKFNVALNTLKSEFNAYGALYSNLDCPHFSGNFWWVDSTLVQALPQIGSFDSGRWNAEFWIGRSDSWSAYSPYQSLLNPYYSPIPESLYVAGRPKRKEMLLLIRCFLNHFWLVVTDLYLVPLLKKRNP